jgi:hypothetical protein
LCKHGEWLPWLAANFAGDRTTAARYMQIASNVAHVQHLDSASQTAFIPDNRSLVGVTVISAWRK